MYKYSHEEDKRTERIILRRVYVLDDGLGDIVALCRMARKFKESIEKFNSEKSSLYKYSIVPVICCPKNYLEKVKSCLKNEGIISSEDEIGKTVHIILGSHDVSIIHSEGPPCHKNTFCP